MTSKPDAAPDEVTRPAPDRAGVVSRRQIVVTCLGFVLLQLSWLLVLPAFAGMDEFDHAYRASAVARGEWIAEPTDATRGTGAWVHAPADIVTAANAECAELEYTSDAECVGDLQADGLVRVASGAGRYNPLFYAAVGYPALVADGVAAIHVMRVVNAALCTSMLFLALMSLRRWSLSTWAFAGAVVACTPVLAYSSVVVAPNGLEMFAGLAFWCAAFGLMRSDPTRPDRFLVTVSAVSGSALLLLRSMGPLWVVLIALTVLAATPQVWSRTASLLRAASVRIGILSLVLAGVGSLTWIRLNDSLVVGVQPDQHLSLTEKLTTVLGWIPVWVFQSVAAFPYRNQHSVPMVYACYFFLFAGLVYLGLRRGSRTRKALALSIVFAVAVPALVAFTTIDRHFDAWQGRYGLPYAVGIALLAGFGLDRFGGPLGWRVLGPAVALFTIAAAAAVIEVLRIERNFSPSVATGAWDAPEPLFVWGLAILGAVLMWACVVPATRRAPSRGVPGEATPTP